MRLRSIKIEPLRIDDWELASGQIWCVLGNNASGKSLLAAALCGKRVNGHADIVDGPRRPAWISFETLQAQYEEELANDESDYMDRLDTGSTGLELLRRSGADESAARSLAERYGVSSLLDRGCRLFSSGELRRIQLLSALLADPDLLILDEPFDALDQNARDDTHAMLGALARSGHNLLLMVNRLDDVADWCTHLALLQDGRIRLAGERGAILASDVCRQLLQLDTDRLPAPPPPPGAGDDTRFDPILRLQNGAVRYGDTYQFKGFDWTLRPGEHTLVTGPNGCGKSTLLNLINGDHPQCYANDLQIFGFQRGTGESIWQIKRHLGLVSPALHRDYRAGGSVATVVVSGFFDSIGLYETPTAEQRRIAGQWLATFGMRELADRPFRSLSYGQQRLALIARGLVKQPPLLILDEPTQGLDDPNRHLVLAYLERLAGLRNTTLLFVSHRQDEHLALFRNHLNFVPADEPDTRYRIETRQPAILDSDVAV